ncbi:hypothetical protein N7465_001594 [Penicillium sp. CMV-2018d]|nr:hypothetical protein N7465_001594 [Penicillium sp. CMV-2018d]
MDRAWFTEKLETVTGNHNTLESLKEKVHIANPDWKSFDVDKMLNEKQLKKKELRDDKVLRTTRMPTPCVAKHANMDTNGLPLLSSLNNSGVDDQFAQMLPARTAVDWRPTRADTSRSARNVEWQRKEVSKRLEAEDKYFDPGEPRNLWIPREHQYGTDDNNEWVPPPNGTKLSDEGVYMATKTMTAVERGVAFPVDFDKNGHVRATRTPEDPAPLGWAPFQRLNVAFNRGRYALYVIYNRKLIHGLLVGLLDFAKSDRLVHTMPEPLAKSFPDLPTRSHDIQKANESQARSMYLPGCYLIQAP